MGVLAFIHEHQISLQNVTLYQQETDLLSSGKPVVPPTEKRYYYGNQNHLMILQYNYH